MSDENISKGKAWFYKVLDAFSEVRVCVICVTSENVKSPWIYFESGAVATKFLVLR